MPAEEITAQDHGDAVETAEVEDDDRLIRHDKNDRVEEDIEGMCWVI